MCTYLHSDDGPAKIRSQRYLLYAWFCVLGHFTEARSHVSILKHTIHSKGLWRMCKLFIEVTYQGPSGPYEWVSFHSTAYGANAEAIVNVEQKIRRTVEEYILKNW